MLQDVSGRPLSSGGRRLTDVSANALRFTLPAERKSVSFP